MRQLTGPSREDTQWRATIKIRDAAAAGRGRF
jgi:hypothetical protein